MLRTSESKAGTSESKVPKQTKNYKNFQKLGWVKGTSIIKQVFLGRVVIPLICYIKSKFKIIFQPNLT